MFLAIDEKNNPAFRSVRDVFLITAFPLWVLGIPRIYADVTPPLREVSQLSWMMLALKSKKTPVWL